MIVNYKTPGLLKQCLRGIAAARFAFTYEVLVVDNASDDGSAAMVREQFPTVTLIEARSNRGLAAGNNLGLHAARGRAILILNPDLAVFTGVVERLLRYLDEHERVGIVAPQLRNPDGSIQISACRFPETLIPLYRRSPLGKLPFAQRALRQYLMRDWDRNDTRPVDWVLGACLLVRRAALEQVGAMDERFFLYFEDVDWCRRFWERGWQVVYCHDVALTHYHQRLSAESPGLTGIFSNLTRVHIISGVKYFLKYHHREIPTNHA